MPMIRRNIDADIDDDDITTFIDENISLRRWLLMPFSFIDEPIDDIADGERRWFRWLTWNFSFTDVSIDFLAFSIFIFTSSMWKYWCKMMPIDDALSMPMMM